MKTKGTDQPLRCLNNRMNILKSMSTDQGNDQKARYRSVICSLRFKKTKVQIIRAWKNRRHGSFLTIFQGIQRET